MDSHLQTPSSYGYNQEQAIALWQYSATAVNLPTNLDLPLPS
jgi:hypothetical protein